MANALKTLFTDIATAIRETLVDVGKMSPNSFPDRIREVAQAGGSSDLVKYVTFMSWDRHRTPKVSQWYPMVYEDMYSTCNICIYRISYWIEFLLLRTSEMVSFYIKITRDDLKIIRKKI